MIRVCRTKRDLHEAEERQAREDRKRERNVEAEDVEVVLDCKPCEGRRLPEISIGKEVLRGILFADCEDILCPEHALAFRQRKDGVGITMKDLLSRLQRYEVAEMGLRTPQLYVYIQDVAASVANLTSA